MNPQWRRIRGLMSATQESALASLHNDPDTAVDCHVRITLPVTCRPAKARRTLVLGTADFGWLPAEMIENRQSLAAIHQTSDAIIISPSEYSKWGLLRAGAVAERVSVVPHGVDVDMFRPAEIADRAKMREKRGWADRFVFINISAHTLSKGTDLILRAFAKIAPLYPHSLLVLKGSDAVYRSSEYVHRWLARLRPAERDAISGRVLYVGAALPFGAMAELLQAADAYISPYRSESFNLPALEAVACGLPLICTAGGPTDEFTTGEFAVKIPSSEVPGRRPNEIIRAPSLDALTAAMGRVIEDADWRRRAQTAGPAFARENFTWAHAVDKLLKLAW